MSSFSKKKMFFVMATFHLFTHHHCFTALFTILEAQSAPFPPQSKFFPYICVQEDVIIVNRTSNQHNGGDLQRIT